MLNLCSDNIPSNNGAMSQQGSSKKKKHSKRGNKVSESARLVVSEIVSKENTQEEKIKIALNESTTAEKVQGSPDEEERAGKQLSKNVKRNEDLSENPNQKSAIILIDKEDQLEGKDSQEIILDSCPQIINNIGNNNLTKTQEELVQIQNNEKYLFQQSSPLPIPSNSIEIEEDFHKNDGQSPYGINKDNINYEESTKQTNNEIEQEKSAACETTGDVNYQDIFLTPQKLKSKPNHSHLKSIFDNTKNQKNTYLNSSSVSSASTASSSTSLSWRNPAACPQKESEEIIREHRAEDRLHMLTQVLPREQSKIDSYLDLGCGNCEISAKIASHFAVSSLVACDVYPVENSQRPLGLPSDVKFEYIANENNKFTGVQDASLDLVTCFMVLHHIEEIHTNMLELKRITKEGGYLYIREHDVPANDIQLDKYLREKHGDFHDGGVLFMKFFAKNQLKKMLGKYGFRHVADSMYSDSRPNRQKVYHSLFVKDSSLSESNSSEESTEESDRSSSITISRFSEQDGDEQENAKFMREEAKKTEKPFNFFGRTLFQNQSRDGSPTEQQPPSLNRKQQSDSSKYAHQRKMEPTQLLWRNSCSNQSQVQSEQKSELSQKSKKNYMQHWRDNQRINNYGQTQGETNWKNNRFSQQNQIDDFHKAKKFPSSKMEEDELDFDDEEREKKHAKKQLGIMRNIPCSQALPANKQALKIKEIKPVQLIDILS